MLWALLFACSEPELPPPVATVPVEKTNPADPCSLVGPEEGPPVVLLVSMDTARADGFSVYGTDVADTPVVDALAKEGLALRPVPLAGREAALGDARTDADRLGAIAGDGGWVVMVEARARFFSQLEGRWRWVVEVRVGLGPADSLDRAVFETFEVPVFLRHEHQGPEAAIDAAAPQIGPKVARLLRQQLGAEPARW